jgi:FlaA1/EpsC-like NDP-sugar epimerase
MARRKRSKGEKAIEAMLDDIEASQWDESRMYAIVQSLDVELNEIAHRLRNCLKHDMRPERREEFRALVRELVEGFSDHIQDILEGASEDDE